MASICATLGSVTIRDKLNRETEVSYEELASVPRVVLETVREKDGTVKSDIWEGFRFDNWLKEKGLNDFSGIRFASADRFQVSMERAEFDTLECWLVFSRDGVPFENNSPRIVFPALRDMYWVRDLDKVFLEDIIPITMPSRFYPLDSFLAKFPPIQDPEPFKGILAWRLNELFGKYDIPADLEILFVSADMMKIKLLWGEHLQNAVLETHAGKYNLKSPAIPGGMWLKDIVYLQIGSRAYLREKHIGLITDLDNLLQWKLVPGSIAILHSGKIHTYLKLNELMLASKLLGEQDWFELFQP
jgi:hypothetical protein